MRPTRIIAKIAAGYRSFRKCQKLQYSRWGWGHSFVLLISNVSSQMERKSGMNGVNGEANDDEAR